MLRPTSPMSLPTLLIRVQKRSKQISSLTSPMPTMVIPMRRMRATMGPTIPSPTRKRCSARPAHTPSIRTPRMQRYKPTTRARRTARSRSKQRRIIPRSSTSPMTIRTAPAISATATSSSPAAPKWRARRVAAVSTRCQVAIRRRARVGVSTRMHTCIRAWALVHHGHTERVEVASMAAVAGWMTAEG
ncbi:hypothetical protein BJ165DRAFT_1509888 [Panaeolus papilionaceus]|nr:hypothetical protein BJ165DRAFT_1509888 [Panaeolus papilionaceus]